MAYNRPIVRVNPKLMTRVARTAANSAVRRLKGTKNKWLPWALLGVGVLAAVKFWPSIKAMFTKKEG